MSKGWYTKSEYVHLWIHLLMKANHQEREFWFNGKTIKVKRGQFVTGRKVLSMETGISESKIERILKCFEIEQQIEQQTNNRNRLISISYFDKYQTGEQQIEQQMDNKRTTSEQQVDTNKNEKNYKNENKYFESDSLNDAFVDFKKHRKQLKKPMTERAIELAVKKLKKETEQTAIKMIENSIENGWSGLFELKNTDKPKEEFSFDPSSMRL